MRPTILLFLPPATPTGSATPTEQWVAGGRWAATQALVEAVADWPVETQIVIATPDREQAAQYLHWPVTWDFDPPVQPFTFGPRLIQLLERYPAPTYLYLGGGSAPLFSPAQFATLLAEVAAAAAPRAIANNWHSADWLIFNCPRALSCRPERLISDNALGWVLKHEARVPVQSQPASAATRFDIDTPTDLALLAHHPHTPLALQAYLQDHPAPPNHWLTAAQRLFTPYTPVALLGRVAPTVWAHVEAHTRAWVRVFSEERGMVASGRAASGQVRSWLGQQLSQHGPAAFFEELGELAAAAFFDTRVVWAHQGWHPTPADRFAADLGLMGQIEDPALRAFAAAAHDCNLPLVCGGHTVVAGGLYALVEIAQQRGWTAPTQQ